jgi:hypothetical protein
MQNARCKNKKLQIASADSRADRKIRKMQIARKIFSADIILQIAAQICCKKFLISKYPLLVETLSSLNDRFQKYVHCTGIIFDVHGILMKISFFAESSIIMVQDTVDTEKIAHSAHRAHRTRVRWAIF